jgi:hypothetical protein
MGDFADMVIEGIMCEMCGVFIDAEGCGHPQKCDYCEQNESPEDESENDEQ